MRSNLVRQCLWRYRLYHRVFKESLRHASKSSATGVSRKISMLGQVSEKRSKPDGMLRANKFLRVTRGVLEKRTSERGMGQYRHPPVSSLIVNPALARSIAKDTERQPPALRAVGPEGTRKNYFTECLREAPWPGQPNPAKCGAEAEKFPLNFSNQRCRVLMVRPCSPLALGEIKRLIVNEIIL